jgi:hypothetical protein
MVPLPLRLSGLALIAIGMTASPHMANAACSPCYNFTTIDNPNDANFNQLLGINRAVEIVGYDGDGSVQPNKGYLVVPLDHFADENFPQSAQTQVVGINNATTPATVGFWIDGGGNNFGFYNRNGSFVSVADPKTGVANGVQTNQLLGINDHHLAAGFYNDANGNSHGYIYDAKNQAFSELTLPFKKVVSFQATGINNAGVICGFYTNGKVTKGFIGTLGNFSSVSSGGIKTLTLLGLNNTGLAVGTFTDNAGVSHGLTYDINKGAFTIVDNPNESATAAFGVTGTTINGINDAGDLVGFYSDGTKVHGFLAQPTKATTEDDSE